MKLLFLLASFTGFAQLLSAQTTFTADFEDISLAADTFLNGSDGQNSFTTGDWECPVDYNSEFGYWASGTAISSMRDTNDGSFTNLYSAFAQDTALNNFGVANLGSQALEIEYTILHDAQVRYVSIDLTNITYTRESLKNGDFFAKKFGGLSGDDPDYFFVRISNGSDSIDFYLADFRFEDNTLDYIIEDWTTVDLSSLEMNQNTLSMRLFSSDTGAFGINTPLFFAYDNLVIDVAQGLDFAAPVELTSWVHNNVLYSNIKGDGQLRIYDAMGRTMLEISKYHGQPVSIDGMQGLVIVSFLSEGRIYNKKYVLR